MSQSSRMNPEIYKAAMSGDWETIKRLRSDFATQETPNGNTILHVLAEFSDSFAHAVQQIPARERDLVFKKNKQGETPLVIASRRGHCNLVRALIDSVNSAASWSSSPGAKITERTQMLRVLGYHLAVVEAVMYNAPEIAKLLLQVEEGVLDDHDVTPLWLRLIGLKLILRQSKSPLYLAVEKGYDDIVALILSKSKVFIHLPDWRTPLHAAALRNSLDPVLQTHLKKNRGKRNGYGP